ncbi:MAG: LLM class F420-dependent oxidoreductase [Acidimicrobiales bacterium]
MRYGVAFFPTAYAIAPARLGEALEERGFESLWVAEHTHIPADRRSPWPGGAELPRMYYDTLDPFVALTAAAASTSTLKVATGICLIVERDPIVTAKQVASLDVVSGGRFLFGIGGGWNAEEMHNHGTVFARRWKLMRERVEAMQAIWHDDPAEYHGELVDFDPIHQNPKPVQNPHPPIHVGGGFPGGLRRALRYGDGWIPIGARGGDLVDALVRVPEEAAALGRDPSELELSVYYAGTGADERDRLAQAGVDRLVFALPSVPADEALPILDEYAEIIAADT